MQFIGLAPSSIARWRQTRFFALEWLIVNRMVSRLVKSRKATFQGVMAKRGTRFLSDNRASSVTNTHCCALAGRIWLRCGIIAAALAISTAGFAAPLQQVADDDGAPVSVSHPVVEPTGSSAGKALNTALGQLAKDPRNIDALLAAGDAAIALGDNEAALGFYTRADQLAPTGNGKVKAAIAGARLHLDDPVEALRWYAQAEQAGIDPVGFASDRGLAFDLVGDNAAAVVQYRKVLDHSADAAQRDEVTRRLALSLAMGGDRRGAERTLLPLLQRQDRAAWRTHTFVLAIAGRSDEAVSVARATMPPDLAEAIAPYLRFMVRLTPSQQAAVVSLGKFPRAAEIGRDDAQVIAYTAAHPRVTLTPAAPAAPVLAQAAETAPVEAKSARARHRRAANPAPVASAAPVPAEPEIVLPAPPPPPVAALASTTPPPAAPAASRTTTPARSGFDLAQVSGSAAPHPAPATTSETAASVPRPTVLSRLDMPPAPHRTPATKAPTIVALASPQIVTPSQSPAVIVADTPSHAVVQPIPAKPAVVKSTRDAPVKDAPVKDAPVKEKTGKGSKDKSVKGSKDKSDQSDQADSDKPQKGKASHGKDKIKDKIKDKAAADDEADTKSAHGKSIHGKAAKEDAAETVLPPCKPAAAGKGHKGKGARPDHAAASKAKSRHGKKGKPEPKDSETCAPSARGDRPDGPGDVSRDSDSEDNAKAKGKTRGKGHDKSGDSDKASTKGGRHARYASRIWVEVLTGADRDKMPGEWRNLLRKAHALKKHKPYLTPWRSNFRLLTGPFDSDADAQDFIAELRKDGVSGFEWTSPAGQAVDSLALP